MTDKIDSSVYVHFKGYGEGGLDFEGHEKYEDEKFIIYAGEILEEEANFLGDRTYLEWREFNTGENYEYCDSVFDSHLMKKFCLLFEKKK